MAKKGIILFVAICLVLFSLNVHALQTIQLDYTSILADGTFDEDNVVDGTENTLISDKIDGTGEMPFIKFSTTGVPAGKVIVNATLCLFANTTLDVTDLRPMDVFYVSNQTWVDSDPDDLCASTYCSAVTNFMTTKLTNIIFNAPGGTPHWDCFSGLEEYFSQEYLLGNNFSIGLNHTGHAAYYMVWNSREYATASLRPYMNITYVEQTEDTPQIEVIYSGTDKTDDNWMGTEGSADCYCNDTSDFSTCGNQISGRADDSKYVGINFGGYGLYNGHETGHRQDILLKFPQLGSDLPYYKNITGVNYTLVIDSATINLTSVGAAFDGGQTDAIAFNQTMHPLLKNWVEGSGQGATSGCPNTSGYDESQYNWSSNKYAIFPTVPWADYGTWDAKFPANSTTLDIGSAFASYYITNQTFNTTDCRSALSTCKSASWAVPNGLAENWTKNPANNYGVKIQSNIQSGSSEAELFWSSSEGQYPSIRPKLIITYHYIPTDSDFTSAFIANITAPSNNTAYAYGTNFQLNITVTGNATGYNASYSLDGASNVTIGNMSNATINMTTIGQLQTGLHNITVTAQNGTVVNTSYVNFSVNTLGCGTISSAGNYLMTTDLSTTGNCFTIASNNVNLNCQGHTITGDLVGISDTGVSNTGYTNLTVQNCKIINFNYQVALATGASNSLIKNNNFTNAGYVGIYALSTSNINVTNNFITNATTYTDIDGTLYPTDGFCAFFDSGSNSIIYGNNTCTNAYYGVRFEASSNETIQNNTIINMTQSAFYLSDSGGIGTYDVRNNYVQGNNIGQGFYLIPINNSIFINNTVNNVSTAGRNFYLRSGSNYNHFTNNYVNNAINKGIAFSFDRSNHNSVVGGMIQTTNYAFEIGDSGNNTISNISVTGATKDIHFWSNYGSPNNVTFINTSIGSTNIYYQSGNSNFTLKWYVRALVQNSSYYPLSIAQVNITNATSSNPEVLNSNTDANGYTAWYTLTQFIGNNSQSVSYTPHNFTANFSNYVQKSVLATINSSQTMNITMLLIDTTAPSNIKTVPPSLANNSNTSVNWIFVNATFTELNPDICLLQWGNGTIQNLTMTRSGTNCYLNVTNQPDTTINYTVIVNDTGGNSAQNGTFFVTIDTISPSSIVTVPPTMANNSFTNRNWVFVNTTFTEANPAVCLLQWGNGTLQNLTMTRSGNNCYLNVTNQPQGTLNYTVIINDSVGHIGQNGTFFVTIDTTAPTNLITVPPTAANNTASNSSVYVNITFTETNPGVCLLMWNNGTAVNITMTRIGTNCYTNVTYQPYGYWNYSIFVNDSAGNSITNGTFFVNITSNVSFGAFTVVRQDSGALAVGNLISYLSHTTTATYRLNNTGIINFTAFTCTADVGWVSFTNCPTAMNITTYADVIATFDGTSVAPGSYSVNLTFASTGVTNSIAQSIEVKNLTVGSGGTDGGGGSGSTPTPTPTPTPGGGNGANLFTILPRQATMNANYEIKPFIFDSSDIKCENYTLRNELNSNLTVYTLGLGNTTNGELGIYIPSGSVFNLVANETRSFQVCAFQMGDAQGKSYNIYFEDKDSRQSDKLRIVVSKSANLMEFLNMQIISTDKEIFGTKIGLVLWQILLIILIIIVISINQVYQK